MSLSKYLKAKPSSLKIGKEISRGGNGSVYEGELEGRPVAVKKVHGVLLEAVRDGQGDAVLTAFGSECTRLESITHPLIVGFKGAFYDQHSCEPLLVMERMDQDLRDLLNAQKGTLSYRRQLQLCLDIAKGLHFLHTRDPPLVHRDLSAKNILLDKSGRAKIGDLGQSKLKTAAYFQTKQPGAVVYMPPEALAPEPHYDEKIDIFSFGVLMLEIATQKEPNPGMLNIGSIEEKDRRKRDLACLPANHLLKPLILKCLNNAPDQRPVAAAVLEELEKENPLNFQLAKKCLAAHIKELFKLLEEIQKFLQGTQGCPAAALSTSSKIRASLLMMVDATKQQRMKVVFLGNTSNGKSTVINALVKRIVLPVGNGSVTSCFCTITGIPPNEGGDGYAKIGDRQEELAKVKEMVNSMNKHSFEAGDVLEIFLPAQDSCIWLNQDVVVMDSPGISAEAEVDEEIKKSCGDADVFVYVCNGTSTLEEPVKRLLEHVNRHLPNLSRNLFILFNHWDQVAGGDEESDSDDDDDDDDTKENPERVKEQHLQRVRRFVEQGLKAKAVVDRTFFVSGKEACKVQKDKEKDKQSTTGGVLKRNWQERLREFRKFEAMLHEFLSGNAIQTKCGRHFESCTDYVRQLAAMLEEFKQWCRGELHKRDKDAKSKLNLLGQIEAAEQTLQQTSGDKVDSAVAECDTMFEKFHESVKKVLRGNVEVYREREEKEKWSDYQTSMIEHLDEAMKELMQSFEQKMRTSAIQQLKPLQEAYTKLTISTEEPQAQAEQGSLSVEQPSCTAMTEKYHARPWFGREVLNLTTAFYKALQNAEEDTEVFEVNGEKRTVQKRDNYTVGNDVAAASFWIGMNTLLPPVGALLLSGLGILWVGEDQLAREQVKGKIIVRLEKQLDANKQTIKSQYLDSLQKLLEAQITCISTAITDRKKVLKDEIRDLQQRSDARHAQLTKATKFQDQLEQEVLPGLDRFYSMFLQAESA